MCVIFVSLKQYGVLNQNKSFKWTNHSCLLPRTHIFHLLSRFKAHDCFLSLIKLRNKKITLEYGNEQFNGWTCWMNTPLVSVSSLTQSDYVIVV